MSFITVDQFEQLALPWFQGMSILRLGLKMLPLKSNRPRCFHRGLQPTGNPQSENSGRILDANLLFFKGHDPA